MKEGINAEGGFMRYKELKNVFVAHNGFKFDFRFLYERLYARLGDFKMIGTIQQTKKIEG